MQKSKVKRVFLILAGMFLVFNYCCAKKGKRRNHQWNIVGINERRTQGS